MPRSVFIVFGHDQALFFPNAAVRHRLFVIQPNVGVCQSTPNSFYIFVTIFTEYQLLGIDKLEKYGIMISITVVLTNA